MAAKQQFDYQAEQLLMNKMLILLKEEEEAGGGGGGLKAASPRSGSLSSLRAARNKSPKQGKKSRSKSESEEAAASPPASPPAELSRQSPARKSLLARKGSAEASPTKSSPPQSGPNNGSNTNGSTNNGSPINGSPTNGSPKKGKAKGGLLGLLSSKNKKNKERSERLPAAPSSVPKLQPLQRPLSPTGKAAGKQDAKLEVRRALAMEAQRLRAQHQQQQDGDGGHPRPGRRVPPSPAGSDSLSPEQRRARAQHTESVLQNMHAQLVLQQQGGARSPPSSPTSLTSPTSPTGPASPTSTSSTSSSAALVGSRSPRPDLKLTIRPAGPQPSPRSPPTSPALPLSPISPGVQADRSLPSSPVVPLPSPRTLPSPTSPASPAAGRGPLAAQPTPPSSPKQASSVLLASERGSGSPGSPPLSPPLSPTLSQLDGSPGQRRRAQAAAIAAKRAQSPAPPAAEVDGGPAGRPQGQQGLQQGRQQGRRATGASPTAAPSSPTSPQAGVQRGEPQRRSARRGLLGLFQSMRKGASHKLQHDAEDLLEHERAGAGPPPQRPQQQAPPPAQEAPRGGPQQAAPKGAQKEPPRGPPPQAPQRGPATPQSSPPPSEAPKRARPSELSDVALSMFHQQLSKEHSSSREESSTSQSFQKTSSSRLMPEEMSGERRGETSQERLERMSRERREETSQERFEKSQERLERSQERLERMSRERREATSQERSERSQERSERSQERSERSQERSERSQERSERSQERLERSQERLERTSRERREEFTSSRLERSSQSRLDEKRFEKMSQSRQEEISRESFEKSSQSRQEELSRRGYEKSSQSPREEMSRERFEKSSSSREEELLRERYEKSQGRDGGESRYERTHTRLESPREEELLRERYEKSQGRDGGESRYERTHTRTQEPPREATTSLSYQRGSLERASPSAAGGPGPQQLRQVRPEVQRTEHLLHAERTDQKPPLPRAALADKRGAAEAASSSKKAESEHLPQQDGKTYCQSCKKKCSGEVLRVQDKYFHIACFKCKVCRNSLAQGGFFCKDGAYYCTSDYQRQFGTKCAVCNEYVEGEVVSALGNTYHQKCFTCGRCRQAFPSGERVTYTGKEVLCARCVQIPVRSGEDRATPASLGSPTSGLGGGLSAGGNECAGCHEELKECQALIALDRQWHIWCFKCNTCDAVLHGEYMGKEGVPYCEKDYQKKFGVRCAYCNRYISGKVLQAGDNHHFHPTCARCTKCGDPFGDGEEMYLQGGAIWHPRCGPGPTENGAILNGVENGHCTDTETEAESGRDTAFDRMSSSAVSDMQFSIRSRTPSLNGSFNSLSRKYPCQRTGSPGLILREYKQNQYPEDISRIYTYSYMTGEPTQGYLKRPIDPYDKPPTSPHFHRPSSAASGRGSKLAHLSSKHGSRTGMTVLVDAIRSETPRPRSPHMNNEEPIELAHFPAAKPPQPGEAPKIEREDFPAPPYPYTDPERRRRWSDTYKGVPISDDEDENDGKSEKETEDEKLKREEKELSKIATGIGKVFLHNVREREKLRQWKMSHIDPRNASRTPSAAREPKYHLRYQSPVNASPSRNVDHPRPWEEEEYLDRSSSYRSSVGRSVGAIPSYNVVSSLRSPPKPGYGLRSCTLPASGRNGGYMGYPMGPDQGDYSFSGLGDKTHSTEFSCGKSDISVGSISEVDHRALNVELPVSTTYTGGLGALRSASYSPHLRRSLPNMAHSNSSEPPKIYPYHLLVITNYRLPADVDRCNLERHLSDVEFEGLFGCNRVEFYRLPQWKRNELKRRVRLF